jgi:hypothetical protein
MSRHARTHPFSTTQWGKIRGASALQLNIAALQLCSFAALQLCVAAINAREDAKREAEGCSKGVTERNRFSRRSTAVALECRKEAAASL